MTLPMRMPRPALLAYTALIFGGGVVLTACGHSSPTQFFTLDAVPPAAAARAAYAGPPVKVLAVHIPPTLDREELVSESPAGVMQVHDFERWEAPLGLTARQTVIEDLVGRLPAGAVLGPSAPGEGAATLTADVVAFQADNGGATLQAAWSVTLPGAAAPMTWRAPMAIFQGPSGGDGGAATVHAFSLLLGQLSDEIAADLPTALAELQTERVRAEAAARAAAQPSRVTTRTKSTTTSVHQPG